MCLCVCAVYTGHTMSCTRLHTQIRISAYQGAAEDVLIKEKLFPNCNNESRIWILWEISMRALKQQPYFPYHILFPLRSCAHLRQPSPFMPLCNNVCSGWKCCKSHFSCWDGCHCISLFPSMGMFTHIYLRRTADRSTHSLKWPPIDWRVPCHPEDFSKT